MRKSTNLIYIPYSSGIVLYKPLAVTLVEVWWGFHVNQTMPFAVNIEILTKCTQISDLIKLNDEGYLNILP